MLVNGQQKAGYFNKIWNISQGGSQTASGIYFLRLKVKGDDGSRFVKNIKVLVVK